MNKKKYPVIISQNVSMVIGHVEGHSFEEINEKAYALWESKKFCGVDLKGKDALEISSEAMINVINNYHREEKEQEVSDEDLL